MLTSIEDTVYLEDINLLDIAAQYGTPVYVYSQQAIKNNVVAYQQAFKQLDPLICYAIKANGNLSILKLLAQLGCGFDIVSKGELVRVEKATNKVQQTIFSGVGKSAEEIEYALNADIFCFNIESLAEIDRINQIAQKLGKKAPVSMRINPDVDAKTHPYISTGLKANKFGIAYKDALSAYQYAAQLPHIELIGIDCHIGSQLMDIAPLIEAAERIVHLVDQLAQIGIELKHLDLGGGIGIVYKDEQQIDLNAYAQAITAIIGDRKLHLILEPGRSIIGSAGVLLTTVEYLKHGEEKDFVIVDAAMNDLARPTLYQAYHNIQPVQIRNSPSLYADIVGPICESGDFLGKDRTLSVNAGEVLLVKDAGAYSASMASNYNTRCRAAEVLVSGHQHRLIRQRERLEQLFENEQDYL